MYGVIRKYASGKYGVLLDNERNPASREGLFWIRSSELKFVENEGEENKMTGFNKVAIVNLINDCNRKDYAFALYDSEWALMEQGQYEVKPSTLVVVNARGVNNRVLGTVKKIMSIEEYENATAITAQVVGVVNIDGYTARVNEEARLKELAKKKAAIETELEAEINKRKSVEYYEEMANKYSDNPKLAELVAELKGLGM